MRTLLQKLRDQPFSFKVMLVYVLSMALIILVVTSQQVSRSISVMESESMKSLNMLTDQVSLNYTDNQKNLRQQLYNRLRTFAIPTLMNRESNTSHAALRSALAQTISDSTIYDFVELELLDGSRVFARQDDSYNGYTEQIRLYGDSLLSGDAGRRGYSARWSRNAELGVFYVLDVYDVQPLQYVGKAVFHLKSVGFSLSEIYDSTGMLFLDSEGNYFMDVGMQVSEEDKAAIMAFWKTPKSEMQMDDYFLTKSIRDGWTTIGYTAKDTYYRMRSDAIRVGVTYGCLGLLCSYLIMMLLLSSLTRKLKELKTSMAYVSEGRFDYQIEVRDDDDIAQISKAFNSMTRQIACLLEEVVEKERLKNDAEMQILEYKYRALQTQIRPHFIYNAFETVSAMAKIKGEQEIVDIIRRISKYFRTITVNTTQQFLTIQQEFDALESYTEVYRIIHGQALQVTFSAKPAARNALIPTMLVQPLVENAMEHGLRTPDEISEIVVHAYILDDMLNISVKDNGLGLTDEQEAILNSNDPIPGAEHEGIGLENVRKRLALIYGDRAVLSVHKRQEGGTVSKIVMPMSYTEPPLPGEDQEDWL